MRSGREVLDELRSAPWVDGTVEFDDIEAGLADGLPASSLLATDRSEPSFSIWVTPEQRALLDELRTIARAAFAEMAGPPHPGVELERIVTDFEGTTGRTLRLELRSEVRSSGGPWMCDASLDGRHVGGVGALEDGEAGLAEAADRLCEWVFHEEVWGGWPLCPRHPTRPMWAAVVDGSASWVCEAEAADRVAIGELVAWRDAVVDREALQSGRGVRRRRQRGTG